jgi:hypothetical protein
LKLYNARKEFQEHTKHVWILKFSVDEYGVCCILGSDEVYLKNIYQCFRET